MSKLKQLANDALESETSIPTDIPVREVVGKLGLMHPTSHALEHEAAEMLLDWADKGCPVDTGPDWSLEQIEEALKRGPHQSANEKEAAKFLREETEEKTKNQYAKVVRYGDIRKDLPKNFKISPVSMIPHKSKKFRCILDLSFQLRNPRTGKKWESVNSATTKLSKQQSMGQLGQVVKRIVSTMADHYDPSKPFMFTKLDIKDGFWRMAVSDEAAWNFCYVLPSETNTGNLDDIQIVVPNSLQMGWTESPPCFCAGTETARDVMEYMLPRAHELKIHPLEEKMKPSKEDRPVPPKPCAPPEKENMPSKSKEPDDMSISSNESAEEDINTPTKTLFEVFVDDFMAITNNIAPENLSKISRVMLNAIHAIFPPPEQTKTDGENAISISKIDNGDGKWNYIKEILGWTFNGQEYTIALPPKKTKKIINQINKAQRAKRLRLKEMQQLAGNLQHASFAMPGGWGLFSPIQASLMGDPKFIEITPELNECLADWKTIVKHIKNNPTHVLQLVDGYPDYLGYTDACKKGAGGVWMGVTEDIGFVTWRVEFPEDIQNELCTSENPKGSITMNDLELAGVILGWLVLEKLVPDLRFKHVGMNCDNSTAVAWSNKYRSAKSIPAARLLRLLSIRMHRRQVSPLLVIHISGDENDMADKSSRSFGSAGNAFNLTETLTEFFNNTYPLPQNDSWQEFKVPSELFSRVMSCVRGERLKMGQLLRLKGIDRSIGDIGKPTYNIGTAAPFWTMRPNLKQTSSSEPLLLGSGQVSTAKAIRLKFKALVKRSRPSPRPSSWLDNPLPSTGQIKNIK